MGVPEFLNQLTALQQFYRDLSIVDSTRKEQLSRLIFEGNESLAYQNLPPFTGNRLFKWWTQRQLKQAQTKRFEQVLVKVDALQKNHFGDPEIHASIQTVRQLLTEYNQTLHLRKDRFVKEALGEIIDPATGLRETFAHNLTALADLDLEAFDGSYNYIDGYLNIVRVDPPARGLLQPLRVYWKKKRQREELSQAIATLQTLLIKNQNVHLTPILERVKQQLTLFIKKTDHPEKYHLLTQLGPSNIKSRFLGSTSTSTILAEFQPPPVPFIPPPPVIIEPPEVILEDARAMFDIDDTSVEIDDNAAFQDLSVLDYLSMAADGIGAYRVLGEPEAPDEVYPAIEFPEEEILDDEEVERQLRLLEESDLHSDEASLQEAQEEFRAEFKKQYFADAKRIVTEWREKLRNLNEKNIQKVNQSLEELLAHEDSRLGFDLLLKTSDKQGVYLGSNTINAYIELLKQHADESIFICDAGAFNFAFEKSSKFVNKIAYLLNKNEKNPRIATELLDQAKEKATIFIPLYVTTDENHSHWALCEINKDDIHTTFRVYNSATGRDDARTNLAIKKSLMQLKDGITHSLELKSFFPRIEEAPVIWNAGDTNDNYFPRQQDGGHNCGVFICQYMKWRIQGNHLATQDDCVAFNLSLPVEERDHTIHGFPNYGRVRKNMFQELIIHNLNQELSV